MTPKEKAEELVEKYQSGYTIGKFNYQFWNDLKDAKQCALIAVENEYNSKIQAYNEMAEFCPDVAGQAVFYAEKEREQVKQEIEKL